MRDAGEREERGYTVVDRRGSASAQAQQAAEAPQPAAEPGVDFATFCVSLASSALYHLGSVPHPETRETVAERNLPLARQTIDSLEMLEQKTRGNLTAEELKLLQSLLYELRMRYVEASRAPEGEPAA
jgi:hypothetical protein